MDLDAALVGFAPIRYYNRIRNNGDSINPYIAEWASGSVARFASHDEQHLLAIGSVLFMANANSLIWGTGLLNRSSLLPPLKKEQFFAVRGTKTRDFLIEKGIDLSGIPLGDPGIFASKLIPESKLASKYRAAVIPHHNSIDHEFYRAAARQEGVVVVDILSDGLKVIEQIRDSEVVISESLHGLVFAESFSKPSVWISRHIGDSNWDFKFLDWYSTTGTPNVRPVSIKESVGGIIQCAARSDCRIDLRKLQAAFPSQSIKQVPPLLQFRDCRSLGPVTVRIQRDLVKLAYMVEHEAIKGLTGAVSLLREQAFRGWSERSYLFVQFSSAPEATTAQIAKYCRLLDEKLAPDFVVLVSNQTGRTGDLLLGDGTIARDKITGPLLELNVIGFLIRPDYSGLNQNWWAAAV
jgi:hypothetical protein